MYYSVVKRYVVFWQKNWETWIQVFCFSLVLYFATDNGEKIARYNLYIYTPIRNLGGGGLARLISSHLATRTQTHADAHKHARQKAKSENWKAKMRNPSLFRCENENKTRWKSKSIKYKVEMFCGALFVSHTHKMQ